MASETSTSRLRDDTEEPAQDARFTTMSVGTVDVKTSRMLLMGRVQPGWHSHLYDMVPGIHPDLTWHTGLWPVKIRLFFAGLGRADGRVVFARPVKIRNRVPPCAHERQPWPLTHWCASDNHKSSCSFQVT